MPFLVSKTLEGKPLPLTDPDATVLTEALDFVEEHDFSQLPVIGQNTIPYNQFTRADVNERCKLYNALTWQAWNPNDPLEGSTNASS